MSGEGELIQFPNREPVEGELVDADHDGIPDTKHAGGIEKRAESDPVHAGTPLDGELVDDTPEPVDKPNAQRDGMSAVLAARTAKRRPVVAPWVRDRGELKSVARWAAGHAGHIAAFHTVRSPIYGARLAARSPVGVARLAARGGRWVFGHEHAPLRAAAVKRGDSGEYLQLERLRSQHVKRRLPVAALAVLAVVGGTWVATVAAPWWLAFLVDAALVATFGVVGAPRDRPIIGQAVVPFRVQRLTSDIVVRALASLGVAEINKAVGKKGGVGITFPAPITRDGPGWRADIDLPYGVTVTDILERRDSLASGLRRPLGCVWPEGDVEQHAGRLVLWVGDTDLRKTRQPAWPLLKAGQADLFTTLPFGTDQRGRPIGIDLMFANLLLGAMPRQGKTAALRLVLLGCALDPTAELRIFELKGTGDLGPLEPVAHHYASGADDESIEATVQSLRELYRQLETRAAAISELAKRNRALVPDNKVTPELAGKRSLGLFPLVMAIDECQELFTNEEYGKEAAKLATAIIKRGPALGVILLLATQRPDKDSLPKAISANVSIRFCLKVDGQIENDMVLGTSKYQQGIRATVFTPILDAGIGYLVGAGPVATVTRTYYVNGPKAEKVVERARALREAAGTLSGHAVGDDPAPGPGVSLTEDIATVFGGAKKLHSEQIVAGLIELRPDLYEGLTVQAFGQMIETEQVWIKDPPDGGKPNRKGLRRESLMASIEAKAGLEP